jgi:hypothetical protein
VPLESNGDAVCRSKASDGEAGDEAGQERAKTTMSGAQESPRQGAGGHAANKDEGSQVVRRKRSNGPLRDVRLVSDAWVCSASRLTRKMCIAPICYLGFSGELIFLGRRTLPPRYRSFVIPQATIQLVR